MATLFVSALLGLSVQEAVGIVHSGRPHALQQEDYSEEDLEVEGVMCDHGGRFKRAGTGAASSSACRDSQESSPFGQAIENTTCQWQIPPPR